MVATQSPISARVSWPTSRSWSTAAVQLAGKTAAMLVKVERLSKDLSQVRLFHTSVTRAIASWPTWPGEPGFTGDFEDYVAATFPSSQAGDFAVLESGIVSEETYSQQGLYWEKSYHPIIKYVLDTYKPDLALVGYPGTDEFSHQFLGLVTKTLPNGEPNPAYDDVEVNGTPDGRVRQREGFIRRAYQGSDATMRLAQDRLARNDKHHGSRPRRRWQRRHDVRLIGPRIRAAVPRDRRQQGAGRPRLAVQATDVELPSRCRRDHRQGQGLLGRRSGADLSQPGRSRPGVSDTQVPPYQQVAAADEATTVAQIKAAYQALADPNDWTGDGAPRTGP